MQERCIFISTVLGVATISIYLLLLFFFFGGGGGGLVIFFFFFLRGYFISLLPVRSSFWILVKLLYNFFF